MALRTYESGGQTFEHQSLTQFVRVEGLDTLRRLLNPPDELIAEPWKTALTALAAYGERSGKSAAPYRRGLTQSKIKGSAQKKPMPRWAAVRSRGSNKSAAYPRGYPYPRLLNYAPKYGHVGWFDRGVIEPVMAQANSELNTAANKIASKWGRY